MINGKVFASLLLACLPGLSIAQSGDDLYFVPKKEQKKEVIKVVPEQTTNTTAYTAPESAAIVVKDVKGNVRDVDEYNRRYTSRENTFSMQNDTIYIQEKPYGERGEWINGFEGSQSDYEYAMRIVRFRSPGYAIPISSPLYWDVVYGALPSWDWNVFDDGMYAYVFPTSTNPAWWDWRFSWGTFGPRFSWNFRYSWYNPWYFNGWYSPYWYGGFYSGYWGGYWGSYWGYGLYPYYGHWAPRNWGYSDRRPGRYQASHSGSTRPSGFNTGRNQHVRPSAQRIAQDRSNTAVRRSNIGRVVNGNSSRGDRQSVLSGRTAIRNSSTTGTRVGTSSRTQGVYTRPAVGADRNGSTYNRPSSTRRSVNSRNGYNNYDTRNINSTYQRSNTSGSYNRSSSGSSFNRSSGSSFNRSSGGSGVSRGGGRRR